jgi:hypothetical protein
MCGPGDPKPERGAMDGIAAITRRRPSARTHPSFYDRIERRDESVYALSIIRIY